MLLHHWRFVIACHVAGRGILARYGIVTWALLYSKEVGGFDIQSMALATVTFPTSMALGAPIGGIISDRWTAGQRSPMIVISCLVLSGIAFASPANGLLGMALMVLGGMTLTMAPAATGGWCSCYWQAHGRCRRG
jgi:sugar phosphate permease